MDNNELMHYGVLGMKWGARRNAAKAYSKAVKKQQKLNKNIDDAKASYTKAYNKTTTWASRRYKKLQAEADRYQSKANRKKYGWFPNKKKADAYQFKADRYQYKANNYKYKHEERVANAEREKARYMNAQRKAEKWQKAMDKTFANVNINSIANSSTAANGKKKVNALLAS